MELVISIDKESLSIPIDNPFKLDLDAITAKIEDFLSVKNSGFSSLDINGLLPKMVKGIAGCEKGCPADAMYFVSKGYKNFELAYIEGGILTAKAPADNGKLLLLKMFPDF